MTRRMLVAIVVTVAIVLAAAYVIVAKNAPEASAPAAAGFIH